MRSPMDFFFLCPSFSPRLLSPVPGGFSRGDLRSFPSNIPHGAARPRVIRRGRRNDTPFRDVIPRAFRFYHSLSTSFLDWRDLPALPSRPAPFDDLLSGLRFPPLPPLFPPSVCVEPRAPLGCAGPLPRFNAPSPPSSSFFLPHFFSPQFLELEARTASQRCGRKTSFLPPPFWGLVGRAQDLLFHSLVTPCVVEISFF